MVLGRRLAALTVSPGDSGTHTCFGQRWDDATMGAGTSFACLKEKRWGKVSRTGMSRVLNNH